MKTVSAYMMALAVSFAFFSCNKSQDMLTVVHGDGSITREFSARYQIEKMNELGIRGTDNNADSPFPVEVDSTWTEFWSCGNQVFRSQKSMDSLIRQNAGRDFVYFHIVRKDFASAEDLALNFHLKKSHPWANVKVDYRLDRKFRWFYTDYIYRETYPKLNVKFTYPLDKFMSKNEADYWFSGTPNLTAKLTGMEARDYLGGLENKCDKWLRKNLWSDQFDLIVRNYGSLKNKPISKERLILLKDSIFASAPNREQEADIILNAYFKTTVFSELQKQAGNAIDSLAEAKYGALWQIFEYKLCMPGEILRSNSDFEAKDTLTWNMQGLKFLTRDYVVEAESRKTNVWAFVLTGLIIVVAIGSFFFRKNRFAR
jgi:hypothetical protein